MSGKSQVENLKTRLPKSKSRRLNPQSGNAGLKHQNSDTFLARITGTPELARAVPLLRPEVLHAVITHCGLQDSGELLALATTEQLSGVFDLDLWKANRAGGDAQFNAARFCEWLEILLDAGAAAAAARLAEMDAALLVAGLSANIKVFDLAVFSPAGEVTGADPLSNDGREQGAHAEIGGYFVAARRPDSWDTIVEVLRALAEQHAEPFHRAMEACRQLSNAGWELDGLDSLLSQTEQANFDLSVCREERQDRLGFLPPPQARAFLESARRVSLTEAPPQRDPVFSAYERFLPPEGGSHGEQGGSHSEQGGSHSEQGRSHSERGGSHSERGGSDEEAESGGEPPGGSTTGASAVAIVIEELRGAGVLAETPRALLPDATKEAAGNPLFKRYLEACADADAGLWTACNHEMAFLANALVAGCSVQGRPFGRREAMDAVAATCNLGLTYWPSQWPAPPRHGLVTIFQVGWTIVHREVSMVIATQLLTVLDGLASSDRDLQIDLQALGRELQKHQRRETPWRVRDRLDILATFDLPAWAALAALLDEYPVMLANVSRQDGSRPHRVDPSDFQFVAEARHIGAIHEFLRSLPDRLTG